MKNNMRTLENVIAEARFLAGSAPAEDHVARARQERARMIADTLATSGFPVSDTGKARLSLVPLLFQEANYDDLGWTRQHENLRQLSRFFELDHLVQCAGKPRAEASAAAFAAYVEGAFRAIRR